MPFLDLLDIHPIGRGTTHDYVRHLAVIKSLAGAEKYFVRIARYAMISLARLVEYLFLRHYFII